MALTTETMEKVTLAGARSLLRPTIETLHRLHALHVEDYTGGDDFFRLGEPFEEGSLLSERLLKAKGLEKSLELPESLIVDLPSLQEAEKQLDAIEKQVAGLIDERAHLRERIKELDGHIQRARLLAPLGVPLELLSGYRNVRVWVGRLATDPTPDLQGLGDRVEHTVAAAPTGLVGAIVAPAEMAPKIEPLLVQHGHAALEVPPGEGSPDEVAGALLTEKQAASRRLEELDTHLDQARQTHGATIHRIAQLLSIESEKATAPVRFRVGPNSFIIEGWLPTSLVAEARKRLAETTHGKLYFESTVRARRGEHGQPHGGALGAGDAEEDAGPEPPIRYTNPKPAQSFEMMMDLHSRPKYWEFDPTLIIWFTFPLFFGFMIGDLGFGLLIMLVGSWFKRNYLFGIGGPKMGKMLWLAGLYTTLFGIFVYGELFGMHFVAEPPELSWVSVLGYDPHTVAHCADHACHFTLHEVLPFLGGAIGSLQFGYLSKLHDVTLMLGIAVGIGLLQINIGFVMGFLNGLKGHGLRHAVLGKLSWILLQIGIAIVALSQLEMLGLTPGNALVGWVVFGASVVMLIAGEGGIAIMELPSILSNTLSYTRLTAVAMSKAGLALVFNMAAFDLVGGPVGLVILLFGYILLLALGLLAGGLHSLRLQFVEFFTKFYEGGGRTYTPFGHPLSAKAPKTRPAATATVGLAAVAPSESNPRDRS